MFHRNLPRKTFALLALATILLPGLAVGATRYVEKWGSDTAGGSCVRNQPCLTIGYALSMSGRNDRIVVGPGSYFENLLIQPDQEGLRLESSAGRHATTIGSYDYGNTLMVMANRVRIGKRGKGFTFVRASASNSAAVLLLAPDGFSNVRIEGNRFGAPRRPDSPADLDYDNAFGLRVLNGGDRLQVRYNTFVNNRRNGLFCLQCRKGQIVDNRFEGNGDAGLYMVDHSNDMVIARNISSANLGHGIRFGVYSVDMNVRENILERNQGHGLDMVDGEASRVELNIVAGNHGSGINASQVGLEKPFSADGNLVVDNRNWGIHLTNTEQASVERNTVSTNDFDGIRLTAVSGLSSLKLNNAMHNGFCGIRAEEGTYSISRYFAALNLDGPTCGGGDIQSAGPDAGLPGPLRIGKVAGRVGG